MDEEDELADRNIFSDPESEWVRRCSISSASESDGEQPESDQRLATNLNNYTVTHMD